MSSPDQGRRGRHRRRRLRVQVRRGLAACTSPGTLAETCAACEEASGEKASNAPTPVSLLVVFCRTLDRTALRAAAEALRAHLRVFLRAVGGGGTQEEPPLLAVFLEAVQSLARTMADAADGRQGSYLQITDGGASGPGVEHTCRLFALLK
jgi:hypothetical protein